MVTSPTVPTMMIIATANVFIWLIATFNVPTAIGNWLLSLTADHVPGGYGGLAHAQALLYAYMAYVEHNL